MKRTLKSILSRQLSRYRLLLHSSFFMNASAESLGAGSSSQSNATTALDHVANGNALNSAAPERIRLGICGIGTVGGGTLDVLRRNQQDINARSGLQVDIVHVGARRGLTDHGIEGLRVSTDIFAVARDPEVDILVELIGGTTVAYELVKLALEQGKHVVTANKALIAEKGNELFTLADRKGVSIAFESAVAGGIPIIAALREGLAANRIDWLAGIINGTGNFILTEMRDKGRDFADVLAEAQALGYAEADPTFDVEGIDAAHKLVILASIAFGMPLDFNKVFTEGIAAIEPLDVEYAEELGFRIKHLGVAKRQADNSVEIRVHPTLIPEERLIAKVDGVMNAVMVHGDAVGPTLYYGAGAGAEPTASAVIADIVRLCRSLRGQARLLPSLGVDSTALSEMTIVDSSEFVSSYYLRLNAEDRPGVLAQVTQVLSNAGISVRAIIQKKVDVEHDSLPIIILTNQVQEKSLDQALHSIAELESVSDKLIRIRVEDLV